MSEWTLTSDSAVQNAWSYGLPTNPDDVGFADNAVNLTAQPMEKQIVKTDHDIVHVRWKDAHAGDGGWLEIDDYEDDGFAIVETVGFLVPADEPGGKAHHVTVWQTVSERDGIGPFHIPVEMVLELTVLNG